MCVFFSQESAGSGSNDLKSDMDFAGLADVCNLSGVTPACVVIFVMSSDALRELVVVVVEVVAACVGETGRGMVFGFLTKNLDLFSPSISIALVSDFAGAGG